MALEVPHPVWARVQGPGCRQGPEKTLLSRPPLPALGCIPLLSVLPLEEQKGSEFPGARC